MEILKKRYKKNPNIVYRKIGEEQILVPIRKTVGDLQCIYTLNKAASMVWELIDGNREAGEISDKIVEEFEVIPEEAVKDTISFLKSLEEIEAIKN